MNKSWTNQGIFLLEQIIKNGKFQMTKTKEDAKEMTKLFVSIKTNHIKTKGFKCPGVKGIKALTEL